MMTINNSEEVFTFGRLNLNVVVQRNNSFMAEQSWNARALLGFMAEQEALSFLKSMCTPGVKTDDAALSQRGTR